MDTAAIQKAIDAAAKAGGTVVLAPGAYLSGSLFLKSGTELRMDEGVDIRRRAAPGGLPVHADPRRRR